MELPQILGTNYILPAILAIVVIGGLLGLLVLNRKRKARASGASGAQAQKLTKAEKAAQKSAAQPAKSTREGRKAAALAARAERDAVEAAVPAGEGAPLDETGAAVATTEADVAATAAPPAAASSGRATRQKAPKQTAAGVTPAAALAIDPLQRVLASILQGWGDITTDDTNRLSVFRADKVVAALSTIEVPKEGKGNEYARTRLTQLRRFAGQMEQAHRASMPLVAEQEFAGIGNIGGATAGVSAGAAGAAGAGAAAAGAVATGAATLGAAAAAADAVKPAETPAATPAAARKSWYSSEHEEVIPLGSEPEIKIIKGPVMPQEWMAAPRLEPEPDAGSTDTTDVYDGTDDGETAAEERRAEFDWGAPEDDILATNPLKAVDLTWTQGQPVESIPFTDTASLPVVEATPIVEAAPVTPVVEPMPAVQQVPVAQAAPAIPQAPAVDEASRNAEAAVAAAAAAFWGSPDAERLERSADLGKSVSSAADVLALPAGEQADMLAFLEPDELTKVFKSATDKELKKSVIETLEHVNNTASLDAIHICLEDPDPEVQLYALDAAERMLGRMS